MQEISITITVEEVTAILQCLGQMPTQSGAYPLFVKVKQQAESQLQPKSE